MPLVTLTDVLKDAKENGYAVGAFNANNLEYVQGIIGGAVEERAPVIIQASQGAIKYAGLEYIVAMCKAAIPDDIPVVLHLDHGTDMDVVTACIRMGFSSVMFDGSKLPFEENVDITKQVVDAAHRVGISVEGEIGHVPTRRFGQAGMPEPTMTNPGQAAEFATRTGVDALAVSVGSIHGMRERSVVLDVELLKELRRSVDVPLVLHGSSGVEAESIKAAVANGVCKVNIATALNVAFVSALRDAASTNPSEVDPRKLLGPAREALKQVVKERIRLLGSSGRASAI